MARTQSRNFYLEICEEIARLENLRVPVSQSGKGAGIMGVATLTGGLLGGTPGLLLGGTLGSLATYFMTPDFKSVEKIIQEVMTPEQKQQLAEQIGKLFQGIWLKNISTTLLVLSINNNLKKAVIAEITNYFRNELGMSVL